MTLNNCSPFISGKTFTLKNSLEFSSKRLGVQFSSAVYESTKSTVSYNWASRARFKCLHWFKNEAISTWHHLLPILKKINLLLLFPRYSCRKEKSLDTIHANTSSGLIWSNGINMFIYTHVNLCDIEAAEILSSSNLQVLQLQLPSSYSAIFDLYSLLKSTHQLQIWLQERFVCQPSSK